MSGSKRPSTSSLRRFISSRPYIAIPELRRRFALDDPDAMWCLKRGSTIAWVGLPEREASKVEELWQRDEIGLELSVEVRASVVVGVYPMRISRYLADGFGTNGANGALHAASSPLPSPNSTGVVTAIASPPASVE